MAVVWGFGWLWMKGEVERQLDAIAARAADSSAVVTWESRRVSGFPFRLDVDFRNISWREPTGWAIAAPALNSEASVFALHHWVAVAPDGAVITRPGEGAVNVAAKVLRASLSDLSAHPASFSLEGVGLTFSPASGAAPYFLERADELHIHTRAGPSDQGAFYVELDRAVARDDSALGRIAAGKPVNFVADAIYSHASALIGPSWATAAVAWARAGGHADVRRLRLSAGDAAFDARSGDLSISEDGRLDGDLDVTLTQGPRALTALGAAGAVDPQAARSVIAVLEATGAPNQATLHFQAGQTTLGPVALGASPKVY